MNNLILVVIERNLFIFPEDQADAAESILTVSGLFGFRVDARVLPEDNLPELLGLLEEQLPELKVHDVRGLAFIETCELVTAELFGVGAAL